MLLSPSFCQQREADIPLQRLLGKGLFSHREFSQRTTPSFLLLHLSPFPVFRVLPLPAAGLKNESVYFFWRVVMEVVKNLWFAEEGWLCKFWPLGFLSE